MNKEQLTAFFNDLLASVDKVKGLDFNTRKVIQRTAAVMRASVLYGQADMFLILGLFLLQPCVSLATDQLGHSTETLSAPALERLTRVLPLTVIQSSFAADFHSESSRLNVSIDQYANACFDSYLAMQLSPAESGVEKEVRDTIFNPDADLKQIASNWKELMPLTHAALKFRRNALTTSLSKRLSPTTAEFVDKVANQIEPTFIKFILSDHPQRNILKTEITKIALAYKQLSSESRRELEEILCFTNTMNWIKATLDVHESRLITRFWEFVEFNIDGLLIESDFHSSLDLDEVKAVVEKRAGAIGMAPQDYANNCEETLRAMKLTQEEKAMFDLRSAEFMGSVWGQDIFNSTSEMLEVILNESVPFNRLLSKGKSFVEGKLNHLTPKTRELLKKVQEEISHTLVTVNNHLYVNQTEKIQLLSDETASLIEKEEVMREIERVYCMKTAWESIVAERRLNWMPNFNGILV